MKKFRFYTLEELGKKYGDSVDYTLSSKAIYHPEEACGLSYDDFGKTVELSGINRVDVDWMGEEVIEAPEQRDWSCLNERNCDLRITPRYFNGGEGAAFFMVSRGDEVEFHADLKRAKGIRDYLTELVNYLETKENINEDS